MIEKDIIFLRESIKSNQYVYHGSSKKIDVLEPRQAFNYGVKDGEPAVYASSEFTIPMFLAVFDPVPGEEKISCGVDDEYNVHLGATKNILERVSVYDIGFVYVLDKKDFEHHDHHEWISKREVIPRCYIQITKEDIPVEITEIK